ncbi:MAG TPA: extracellular solute-binding protein, partial [Pseudonocardia sp.]
MRLSRRAVLAAALLVPLAACSPAGPDDGPAADGVTTVSVRVWDDQVAAAYEKSFAEFSTQNPDIRVQVRTVPYADYFTGLTLDVASGTADDIYWLNALYFGALADGGKLIDVGRELAGETGGWVPAAVQQYTRAGTLWGVPALTDGRIVVYYNKAMV